MNKELIKSRFSRAAASYNSEARVQLKVAKKLTSFIKEYCKLTNPRVLEIGCGTGLLSRELVASINPTELILNDLCPEMESHLSQLLSQNNVSFKAEDAETAEFQGGMNLIASSSSLQWIEDFSAFSNKAFSTLSNDGYFAFASFSNENLKEIYSLTTNKLPYKSLEEIRTIIAQKFDILHYQSESYTLEFDNPVQCLRHIKLTGANALKNESWSKGILQEFSKKYIERFSTAEEKVTLTYNPIYIIAHKK